MDSKDTTLLLKYSKERAAGPHGFPRRESRELINDTLDSASPPTNRNLNTSKSFSNNSKQRINLLSADVQTDNQTVSSKDATMNFQDPWNSKEVWMNINDIYFEKNVLDGLAEIGKQEEDLAPRFCRPDDQGQCGVSPSQGNKQDGSKSRGVLRDIKIAQPNHSSGEGCYDSEYVLNHNEMVSLGAKAVPGQQSLSKLRLNDSRKNDVTLEISITEKHTTQGVVTGRSEKERPELEQHARQIQISSTSKKSAIQRNLLELKEQSFQQKSKKLFNPIPNFQKLSEGSEGALGLGKQIVKNIIKGGKIDSIMTSLHEESTVFKAQTSSQILNEH